MTDKPMTVGDLKKKLSTCRDSDRIMFHFTLEGDGEDGEDRCFFKQKINKVQVEIFNEVQLRTSKPIEYYKAVVVYVG